jgi:hypothetical protein
MGPTETEKLGFQINALIGKVEAMIALLSVTPAIAQADFDKAKALVAESKEVKDAYKNAKGAPAGIAPSAGKEAIEKIQKGA